VIEEVDECIPGTRKGGRVHEGEETETDDDVMTSYEDKKKQMKIMEILGPQRAHYLPLLDQLIFMEDTHQQNTRKK
jgi:hypothetical protein